MAQSLDLIKTWVGLAQLCPKLAVSAKGLPPGFERHEAWGSLFCFIKLIWDKPGPALSAVVHSWRMILISEPSQWQWELGGAILSLVAAAVTKGAAGYQRRRSETWPISYGQIVNASAEETEGTARLELDYDYRVASELYTGKFKKTLSDENEAIAWAEALRGAQIAVRYDPEKPSRSRLWESDLETIVRASAGSQYVKEAPPLSVWEQVLIYPCLVIALLGIVGSVLTIATVLMGKGAPDKTEWLDSATFLLLIVAMLLARKGGMKTFRTTPGWMKFLSYAVFYYTILGGFLLPRLRSNSGKNPERVRQERIISNADYNLLIYFGAFEACYVRLNSTRHNDEFHSGIKVNPAG